MRAPTPSAAAELLVPEKNVLQQKLDYIRMAMSNALSDRINGLQVRLNIARLKLTDPENAIAANIYKLETLRQRLMFHKDQSLLRHQRDLDRLAAKLSNFNPKARLINNQQKLEELNSRLASSCQFILGKFTHQLQIKARALDTLSPLSTLARGYSITRDKKTSKVIASVKQLKKEQTVTLLMVDGKAHAKILGINQD